MPRITPVHWKVLDCIFVKDGFVFVRQESSHRAYTKKGIPRPIMIPTYKDVDTEIINGLRKTASMSRERYFKLLKVCK
jgi:predicted RNA binding protein YcfA (HicA-like mRNA interferase family)